MDRSTPVRYGPLMALDGRVSTNLDRATADALKRLADVQDRTVSAVVRRAVRELLEREEA